jgi:hypothetical protein
MERPTKEKAALGGAALVNQSQADTTKFPARTQALNPNQMALQAAQELAKSGIPCFPCLPSKAPACPSGFKAATADGDALQSLWVQYPAPLVGVPTGAMSGIDVLDIDSRHGGDRWLADNAANLPLTRTHGTRSDGFHFLLKHREGIRNSASKITLGVDVRGDGGYIIWWPATGLSVQHDGMLADWPEWLVEKLLPTPRQPSAPLPIPHCSRPYVQAALARSMQTVATAPDGSRNHTLNSEVWSLARFIPSGELCAQQIATALASAALTAGLGRQETMRTIASALRARGV